MDAARVERTRAPLSPHASTWRTSPPCWTVKPVSLPVNVAKFPFLCSDGVAGLGVEEVEPADVDGEVDTILGRDRHTRVDPCDAFRRGRTRDVARHLRGRGVCRPHAAPVPHRPGVRREMDERVVSERLDELDT